MRKNVRKRTPETYVPMEKTGRGWVERVSDAYVHACRRTKTRANEEGRSTGLGDLPSSSKGPNQTQLARSILDLDTSGTYRPTSKETKQAYESILDVVAKQFGDQPDDVLRGAAEEALVLLRDRNLKEAERKKRIQELLGDVDEDNYGKLVGWATRVTDFDALEMEKDDGNDAAAAGTSAVDEDVGVAVEFEDDDEEEDEAEESDLNEVVEGTSSEDEAEEMQGATAAGDLRTASDLHVPSADEEEVKGTEIDAYWLQRKVSKALHDRPAEEVRLTAEKLLETLAGEDLHDIENQLVLALDYSNFELIKLLLKNRKKVVWCTRLARAQGDDVDNIKASMQADPEAAAILQKLESVHTSERDRRSALERNIREEARKLKTGFDQDEPEQDLPTTSGRKLLDLEDLVFQQAGHFMSNKTCVLPKGAFRTAKKGYEEVHIPAPKVSPNDVSAGLKRIEELPAWARPPFEGMTSLNRIQSKVCDCALYSPENMLVCAPTGAGKTNVALLTMLHEIGQHIQDDGEVDTSNFKIVYVAPMKALVAEMVGNLGKRLEIYGIQVRELTGDISMTRAEIEETQVIVTTPEKWDIITRKSGERAYTELVKLVIIDEIHLLHDGRGPVLENIVARTLRQVEYAQASVRLVGLSATLPNYEDVAAFLRVKPEEGLFFFDSSFRPCPLQQELVGVSVRKPLQRFQLMNEICYEKVAAAAGKHQVLIFVHSRKETAKTARALRDMAMSKDLLPKLLKEDGASKEILHTEAEEAVKNSDLRDVLPYGFAVHHAGLTRADRTLVEDLFSDGHIQVLVSTATLAWGVNLPAHTVIIKGTQVYNPEKGRWGELGFLDIMQMLGRAGRPQYDTFGEGIIITGQSELQFYLSLFNEQLPVESQFISKIADSLNAEVVLGTVQDIDEGRVWLGYTYLYVRMLQNPDLYGIAPAEMQEDPLLRERRDNLIHTAATILDQHGLIKYDTRTGSLQATETGRIASHFYVTHGTIATYNEHLRPTMGDIDLCRLFALSEEFKFITVREEEKVELMKLIERVPIPVKENFEEPAAKINVLLQAHISRLKLEGLALVADMVYVTQSAGRLMRAIFEIVLRRGWSNLAVKALNLSKMVARRMWTSQTPLRQFSVIPREVLARIERKELPWERYYDLSAQELGELVRLPKYAKALHKCVHEFPKMDVQAHVQPITRSVVKIDLTLAADFQWDASFHGYAEPFWIMVEDGDGDRLMHAEYFVLKMSRVEEDHLISISIALPDPVPPQVYIRVLSDRWLNCETSLPVSFRRLVLPDKNPPATDLLDLQPLPPSVLKDQEFEQVFSRMKFFNPIQTQTFQTLFNSDDNCLICSPAGSGKTACAEIAILRELRKATAEERSIRCVFIVPVREHVELVYEKWVSTLGPLGMMVVSLIGDTTADLKLLARGNVIISIPEHWDKLSRRWKQRKNVQKVDLFMIDDIHMIGGPVGPVLEVIASRMRFISSRLEKPMRILALSVPLANARDLGEWIGAKPQAIFNFLPNARPVPLEVRIQSIDLLDFEARAKAMERPIFNVVSQHAALEEPSLVFVPTRKHSRVIALDLISRAASAGEHTRFAGCNPEDVAEILEQISDETLKHALSLGVGYLHEGMGSSQRRVIEALFESGAVRVLVVSAAACWGLKVGAKTVVVAGTQYYDGTDYAIADLLEMIGYAGRPDTDPVGSCTLLCRTARKDYYKRFLFTPLPIESHLDQQLHDHLNAEVVTHTIESKQDAVDYLTWTFYYRRLTRNPNYYGLTGVSHQELSDHLSELIETVVADLAQSACLAVEEEVELAPLNLGMVAAFYYVSHETVELFSSTVGKKTKIKGLLEAVCHAVEFSYLSIRPGEERFLQKVGKHIRLGIDLDNVTDPAVKANILMQAHFSRMPIRSVDLRGDQKGVLTSAVRLISALVDVISSSGWLPPALAAMELSQMVVQALWPSNSPLLQLPHFTTELVDKCKQCGVENIFDLVEMEGREREKLLGMTEAEVEDVAKFCNSYPNIELNFEVDHPDRVVQDDAVNVLINLEREIGGDMHVVQAPFYPSEKEESWWLVIGETSSGKLLAIKRVSVGQKSTTKMTFTPPPEVGLHELTLYFMSDSYIGCDQEYDFSVNVVEDDAEQGTESEEMAVE